MNRNDSAAINLALVVFRYIFFLIITFSFFMLVIGRLSRVGKIGINSPDLWLISGFACLVNTKVG